MVSGNGIWFSALEPKLPKQWVFNKGQNDPPEDQGKKHFFPLSIQVYKG